MASSGVEALSPDVLQTCLRRSSSREQKLLCLSVKSGFLSNAARASFLPDV